jgi:drug/metabolite transporter (DMT)-like permease
VSLAAPSPAARYILTALFFFALMQIGVKALPHIPAHEIVLFRAGISFVVSYLLLRRKRINPWGKNRKLLFLRGASGTVALILFFYTLQNMPLASAVTIQHLSPVFTAILAGLFFGEATRFKQWLFILVSVVGVIFIKGYDPRVTVLETALGLTAALSSGLAYNFIRRLRHSDHPLVVVLYFPLVTIPTVGLYTIFHWTTPAGWDWAVLLFVGLTTQIAQVYLTRAYFADSAVTVSSFNYVGVVYALFFGFIIFGETIGILALFGIALILFGVTMSQRYRRVEKNPAAF